MRPGEIVGGRFELEEAVGSGATAVVYRARDRERGGAVAIKLLHEGAGAIDDGFTREAAALADVEHAAIVRYVAHGRAHGQPFLAIEWIDGEDLSARLARGPLAVDEAIVLGKRLAAALGAAHRAGIVHRDVKPSNVLLPGGRLEDAKLVDFGIARVRSSAPAAITRVGLPLGTPGYMAPEQARGAKDVDARADVFSLGCVLYEAVTGRAAFSADHPMAILARVLLDEPPRVKSLRAEIPGALDRLIAAMMEKGREARPRDGDATVRALEAVHDAPASATVPPPAASAALGRRETRLVSVVVVAGDTSADDDATLTPDAWAADSARIADLAAARGLDLVRLADGSHAAVLVGRGSATDQAALATRAALGLSLALGGAIGVATGRALVDGHLPVGDAIDRAVRLVQPRGGGVRVDGLTAGLLGDRFELAGDAVVAERASAASVRTLLGKRTPTVGRDRELEVLEGRLDACIDEPGARVMLVVAPSGLGKSRVRHELVERLRARPAPPAIWTAFGDASAPGSPLGMIAQLLRGAMDLHLGEADDQARAKITAFVARRVPEAERRRVSELCGEIVRVPFPDSEQLRAARAEADRMAAQMLRAFYDLVHAEVRAEPLVLLLEDMHWGDHASVRFVDTALRLLHDAPLFVVAFARPEIAETFPALWADRHAETVRLSELPRKAANALAAAVLGDRADAATIDRIVTQAAGNALLLEELLRAVAEGRGAELPDTVLAIVQARLDALPETSRRVLRAASVVGTRFWASAVAALLGGAAADDELRELARRELVVARGEGRYAGEVEYVFRHGLVREAAYASLLDEDRTVGHAIAAEWLEARDPGQALAIAEHFEHAQKPERAAEPWKRAAELALASGDLAAAVARAERAEACGASGATLGELALVRAEALTWQGRFDDAVVAAGAARVLLREGSAPWFGALARLALAHGSRGARDELEAVARVVARTPPRRDAGRALASAAARIALQLAYAGFAELAGELQAMAEPILAEHPGDAALEGSVRTTRAARAILRGDRRLALDEFTALRAAWSRAGDDKQLANALGNLGDSWMHLGRYALAEEVLRESLAAADRIGLTSIVALAHHNLGFALARLGRLDEARAAVEHAHAHFAGRGNQRMTAAALAYLADVHRRRGDLARAEEIARAAVDAGEAHPPIKGQALAALAHVLLDAGRLAEAIAAARDGLALAALPGGIEEGEMVLRLVLAEALAAIGDEAAPVARRDARARLDALASAIDDAELRASFLENVEEHARLLRYD